ncbi:uncharacterized protein B0I36DRAFT_344482 [Microdochium trichocladiopsis]|uniref:DUF7707 domain-containing protein n=1 Tax=Microdochium trichocladiopsis TaxID=1682393 RepID=A0A9P8YJ04_9PEZI|nr:uncharacterized protein B0I36DRAFT_344482 [Microdochium trichocladiopsis]KAH7040803.1 hypothetical protein B0I36DRAFT_344482 [Microdochium trichocladiopsis]
MAHITVAALLLAAFAPWPPVHAVLYSFGIDSDKIESDKRIAWCDDQQQTCITLCGFNHAPVNSCDNVSLYYSCECNWVQGQPNIKPNMTDWARTIPTHICQEAFSRCYNAAADDAARQKCFDDIQTKCSFREPTLLNAVDLASGTTPSSVIAGAATSTVITTSVDSSSSGVMSVVQSYIPDASVASAPASIALAPIIAGSVVGGLVVVIAVACLFYWLGSRRRRRSPSDKDRQPPISFGPSQPKPSESSILSDTVIDRITVDKQDSAQTSSIHSDNGSGSTDKSDVQKTLITEKTNGHEMVRDLSASSPLDDEMYFDTAKYRMPPPTKDP